MGRASRYPGRWFTTAHRADLTDVERLTYLQDHTTESAKEAVRGVSVAGWIDAGSINASSMYVPMYHTRTVTTVLNSALLSTAEQNVGYL